MWLTVVAIVVFCLFPFYWLINMSLKAGSDLSGSAIFPHHPTLSNYSAIFKNPDFVARLVNAIGAAECISQLIMGAGLIERLQSEQRLIFADRSRQIILREP